MRTGFEFHPCQSGIAELVEHGQLDLVFHIDDGLLPAHFQSERLYREDGICVVAHDSRFGDSLLLKQYLAASHVVVSPMPGYRPFRTSIWQLLGQNVTRVYEYFTSAWLCNASPVQNLC
jgi:DNA-binding transcriptional LysR family regulator